MKGYFTFPRTPGLEPHYWMHVSVISSKEVNRPELIGQRVRVRVTMLRFFKGDQEEIPWEEASTLQIGSVAFPPGQYTSPQLHPCHRLFDQDGH